jgi:hypothetical protein
MYFDTDDNIMYVWTGTAWQPLTGDVGITSAESIGSGTDIYAGQVGPTLQFNSIRAAGLSSLTVAANTIDINTRPPTYAEVTGKPSTFPPDPHVHAIVDVTGLSAALAAKEPTIVGGTTAQYWRGDKSWQSLNKAAVGLGNVDNTADADKPLSTPQKTYIDAQDAALATSIAGANTNANNRVAKAGDTMTGDLTIAKATPLVALQKANSGQASQIGGYRLTSQRWGLVLGDTTTEGGSNAGSDFKLDRYSDAGALIDSPLSITRSSGVVNFATTPTVAGSPLIGGATISDTAPATPITGQFWWESDTGALFLRYSDGDSQQWVQVNANGLADAPNDGTFYGRMGGVWAKGVPLTDVTNNPAGAWIIPNPSGVQISGSGGLYVSGSSGLSVNGPISGSSGLTLSSGISAGATIQTPGVIIGSNGLQTNATVSFSNVANFSIGYSNQAGWTTGTGLFSFFFSGSEGYRWEGQGYRPMTDNNKFLGAGGQRWSQLYAGTSTISTSDENEKTDIRPLTDKEIAVAKTLKPLVCAYRWKDAVASKSDSARIHVGVIAQRVEEAFASEGLDARHYGMFCEDEIEEWIEPKVEGEPGTPETKIIEPGRMVKTGRTRLGVRYEEILAFIIGGM